MDTSKYLLGNYGEVIFYKDEELSPQYNQAILGIKQRYICKKERATTPNEVF